MTIREVDNRGPQEMSERERYLEERVKVLLGQEAITCESLMVALTEVARLIKRIAELEARSDGLHLPGGVR